MQNKVWQIFQRNDIEKLEATNIRVDDDDNGFIHTNKKKRMHTKTTMRGHSENRNKKGDLVVHSILKTLPPASAVREMFVFTCVSEFLVLSHI